MSNTPLLSLHSINKTFQGVPAATDLSLDLMQGEILALIGPSGCGKTTALRMVAGFETPDSGRIVMAGRDVTGLAPERRGIGIVFQDYALFPHMTVVENIGFGAQDRGTAALSRYVDMVGLTGLEARFPDQLSGGQQQRVALARSFAAGPGLMLLDEPFSNLDAGLRNATRREVRRLLKESGIGLVLVTHDQEEALTFADRVAVMDRGRVLQCGPVQEVYDRPVNAFVAAALGRTNLLAGQAEGEFCQTALGRVRLPGPRNGAVTLSLRPHDLSLTAANGSANGRITDLEFKGHFATCWIDCAGTELQVDVAGAATLPVGTPVQVSARDTAAFPLTA